MPTNETYLTQLDTSVGTIQRAMSLLAEQGALSTKSRGHLGRIIDAINVGTAWNTAGLAPVRLIFPPQGAREIDELCDRVVALLNELHVAHTLSHVRGASQRAEALRNGNADLIFVSKGAAHSLNAPIEAGFTHSFDTGSYYGANRLVQITRTREDGHDRTPRIAIDSESPDHTLITHTVYQEGEHIFVECPFPDIPRAVLAREVDSGIWHRSELAIPPELCGLTLAALSGMAFQRVWERISAGVLIGLPSRHELGALFRSFAQVDFS